jgi:hypothetical protein
LAILLATAPCCVRAAEMDNFQLRNAADLVGLCLADPAEPLGNAALNFCQGFVTATFRVLMDVQAALPAPLICLPVPSPNRSDAIAAFSLWAKSASARMASPAEDALLAFLTAQYPCPKPGQ